MTSGDPIRIFNTLSRTIDRPGVERYMPLVFKEIIASAIDRFVRVYKQVKAIKLRCMMDVQKWQTHTLHAVT